MAPSQSPLSESDLPAYLNDQHNEISTALARVWASTDAILGRRITAKTGLTRPIGVRQPYVFYLGHLPAFAWNLLVDHYGIGGPMKKGWDDLFARGIDPSLSVSEPTNAPEVFTWPVWNDVVAYRDRIRDRIRRLAASNKLPARAARIIVEHEAMHAETLSYMLAQDAANTPLVHPPLAAPATEKGPEWVTVPGGIVTLGTGTAQPLKDTSFSGFRWDNEGGGRVETVSPFLLARLPVAVRQFAEFVGEGGYSKAELWGDDWKWVQATGRTHPSSWRRVPGGGRPGSLASWRVLTRDGYVDAAAAADWPVSVSAAEACAYATWAGGRLMSEAEWVRAALGPTGESADGFAEGSCTTQNAVPHARRVDLDEPSWCGAHDLHDNGWEITSSVFEPFPGFEPMGDYPGYSTDFFDGDHVVLRGRSWVTDEVVGRGSFRNFYRRRYPFVFSKFRVCRDVGEDDVAGGRE